MIVDRRNLPPRRQPGDRRQDDRRDAPRLHSEAPIRFLRAGGPEHRVLTGELLDVSPTGIRLLLDEQLPESEKLLIEVRDANGRCFNLTAEVVWTELAGQGQFRVGCELRAELTDKQFARLNELSTVAR